MADESGLGPGWYPHQGTPNALRYYDGQRWTDQMTPMAPAGDAGAVPEWVGVVGWLTAIFFPPSGVACGAYLVTKGEKGEGFGMIALAVVFSVLGFLLAMGL